MDLNGKNIVVTGGCSGIGLAFTRKLLTLGVQNVGIFDIVENKNAIQNMKNEFKNKVIEFYKTDVKSSNEIQQSFRAFAKNHQFVDVLVNSAGICNEHKPDDVISINLTGLINTTYESMEFMSKAKGGRGGIVINVASICGILYMPHLPVYNASKHGVMAFTKSMANETNLNIHDIRYIAICPGVTQTALSSDFKVLLRQEFIKNGVEHMEAIGTQTTDQLSYWFGEILPKAENGSAWVINCNQMKEFKFLDYVL